MGISTKSFKFQIKEVKEPSGPIGEFSGYASVYGVVDLDMEVMDPGCFKRSLDQHGSDFAWPMLWSHDTCDPIGTWQFTEDDHGLKATGFVNLEVQRGKEIFALIKQGAVKGISVGFTQVKDAYDDQDLHHFVECKLWESSPCVFPANPEAQVDGVKDALGRIIAKAKGSKLGDDDRDAIQSFLTLLQSLIGDDPDDDPAKGDSDPDEPVDAPAPGDEADPVKNDSVSRIVKEMRQVAGIME